MRKFSSDALLLEKIIFQQNKLLSDVEFLVYSLICVFLNLSTSKNSNEFLRSKKCASICFRPYFRFRITLIY